MKFYVLELCSNCSRESLCSYIISQVYFQQNWCARSRSLCWKTWFFPFSCAIIKIRGYVEPIFLMKNLQHNIWALSLTLFAHTEPYHPDYTQQCMESFHLHSCLSASDWFPLPLSCLLLSFLSIPSPYIFLLHSSPSAHWSHSFDWFRNRRKPTKSDLHPPPQSPWSLVSPPADF